MRERRAVRSLGITAFVVIAVACSSNPDLAPTVRALDVGLSEAREEISEERQRADDLVNQLAELQDELAIARLTPTPSLPLATVPPTATSEEVPEPTAPAEVDRSEAELGFALRVSQNPSGFESTSCELDDIACLLDAATDLCRGLLDSDTATLSRFSAYNSNHEAERPFLEAAVLSFCPLTFVHFLSPPLVLTEGVFAVVDQDAVAPSQIPAGTYISSISRGTQCFWQRRDVSGDIVAEVVAPVATRAITLTVDIEAGETFVTFGCRHWTPSG